MEDLQQFIKNFNNQSFKGKIKIIQDNKDKLTLASNYNWWVVQFKDEELQNQMYNSDNMLEIENEWDHRQMSDLISLLNIDNTGI